MPKRDGMTLVGSLCLSGNRGTGGCGECKPLSQLWSKTDAYCVIVIMIVSINPRTNVQRASAAVLGFISAH